MTDGDKAENRAMVAHLELARDRATEEGRFMDVALFGAAISLLSAPLAERQPEAPAGESEVERLEAMLPKKGKGGRPRKLAAPSPGNAESPGTTATVLATGISGGPPPASASPGSIPTAEIPASVADLARSEVAAVPAAEVALT